MYSPSSGPSHTSANWLRRRSTCLSDVWIPLPTPHLPLPPPSPPPQHPPVTVCFSLESPCPRPTECLLQGGKKVVIGEPLLLFSVRKKGRLGYPLLIFLNNTFWNYISNTYSLSKIVLIMRQKKDNSSHLILSHRGTVDILIHSSWDCFLGDNILSKIRTVPSLDFLFYCVPFGISHDCFLDFVCTLPLSTELEAGRLSQVAGPHRHELQD